MVLVADNLTVTNPEVARAIALGDPEPIRAIAVAGKAAGATYLDINLGPRRSGGTDVLRFVLQALEGVWNRGVLIDSARSELMETAAREWRGPVVLNGYSGDLGRDSVLDVASRYRLEVVVLLMDRGIPRDAEERLALAADLVGRCAGAGVSLERLWIDPVVVPLGWSEGQAYDAAVLRTLRGLPALFGQPVKTMVGISNLTTGATGGHRLPWMQEVFLAAAVGAGLTHALLDIRQSQLVRTARALDVLTAERLFAAGEFI